MKAKKLLAMLLASSMVMALGVTALADEEETDTSINIEGSGDVTLELDMVLRVSNWKCLRRLYRDLQMRQESV